MSTLCKHIFNKQQRDDILMRYARTPKGMYNVEHMEMQELVAYVNKTYKVDLSKATLYNLITKQWKGSYYSFYLNTDELEVTEDHKKYIRNKYVPLLQEITTEFFNDFLKDFVAYFNIDEMSGCITQGVRYELKMYLDQCSYKEVVYVKYGKKYNMVKVPKADAHFDKLYTYRDSRQKYLVQDSAERVVVRKDIYNWIKAGNELPKKYMLVHIDGNTLNDDISNLRCVQWGTQIRLRKYLDGNLSNYPCGFNDTILEMIEFGEKLKQL